MATDHIDEIKSIVLDLLDMFGRTIKQMVSNGIDLAPELKAEFDAKAARLATMLPAIIQQQHRNSLDVAAVVGSMEPITMTDIVHTTRMMTTAITFETRVEYFLKGVQLAIAVLGAA